MTLEEIKDTYSMRDVAARYGMQPNRAGFISCPFHQGDRTPSLKLYERDFHCHACGANGDIFTFVQKMESVSFSKAFRMLGGTYERKSYAASCTRRIRFQQEKRAREIAERGFRLWRLRRMGEVCRILRLLDELMPQLEPYSDEWETAVSMRERNEYKYSILAFGTRQEQEEMRELNE